MCYVPIFGAHVKWRLGFNLSDLKSQIAIWLLQGKNEDLHQIEYCILYSKRATLSTFSQCLHCWSKLRLEVVAFVVDLADFPTTTQFLIKLLQKRLDIWDSIKRKQRHEKKRRIRERRKKCYVSQTLNFPRPPCSWGPGCLHNSYVQSPVYFQPAISFTNSTNHH